MAQSTKVVLVPGEQRGPLQARLAAEAFEFRTVPHALFSVKGADVVATLYASGKLVIQGPDPELFLARFLPEGGAAVESRARSDAGPPEEVVAGPIVGSDECGKGDYFGPLVVAAVRLEPDEATEVRGSKVTDSKRIADTRIHVLGPALRERYTYSVVRLDPPDYNRRYDRPGALNVILAELHAEAIRAVAQAGDRVLVDQFAKKSVMESALAGLDVRLEQRPRAESDPAVAAASVIARQEFLEALAALSADVVVDLHKGAGAQVDDAGVAYCELHGRDALPRVAKMHFKNTAKVLDRLP